MTTATAKPQLGLATVEEVPTDEEELPRTSQSFIGWICAGLVFLGIEIYAVVAWIVSGQAHATPHGPTPIPGWMVVNARIWEVGGLIITAGFIYYFVIRPIRREGRLGIDGYFTIAFATLSWQDPLINYLHPWVSYNTVFLNYGSWTSHILGWVSPGAHNFAEPVLWTGPGYIYIMYGFTLIAVAVMRSAHRRWPSFGAAQLVIVCFVFAAVLDLVAETLWLRLGMYVYPGAIRSVTLFPGKYYQFPLYEVAIFAALFTGFASFRYFLDKDNRTVAERGLDVVADGTRKKGVLRFLAITGALNVIFLSLYCIPGMLIGTHSDNWPAGITSRSYLTDGLCATGGSVHCAHTPAQHQP
jgi:hypothetical protein